MGARQGAGAIGPLPAAEAARAILANVSRQPSLRVPLDDALGSILAEAVTSPLDIPPWTNSAMDGYAARADDVRGASAEHPRELRIVETIPAGSFPTLAIGPGECARIFTGAPLPEGADSVIRQEDTDAAGEVVRIRSSRDAGVNFRLAGEDVRKDSVVLEAGTDLGPAAVGVLASLAVAHPVVYRRPRVGILGSGDEIVDVDRADEIRSGRKVASSNTHTLMALVTRAGGIPVNLGIARDTRESMREHLERATDCDLLVTTAGISVGEHDYVLPTLQEMGLDLKFWKLRMRPGAPVGFGLLRSLPWIGLPGNPVSTMVTFELFVRPAIRKMMGHALPFRVSHAGDRRGADQARPEIAAFPSCGGDRGPDRGHPCPSARPPVRPSDRPAGIRDPHQHGEGKRAPDHSRGPARNAGRSRGGRARPRRPAPPVAEAPF